MGIAERTNTAAATIATNGFNRGSPSARRRSSASATATKGTAAAANDTAQRSGSTPSARCIARAGSGKAPRALATSAKRAAGEDVNRARQAISAPGRPQARGMRAPRLRVGLLARGFEKAGSPTSHAASAFPGHRRVASRSGFPLTVAGPRRLRTGFPVMPCPGTRSISTSPLVARLGAGCQAIVWLPHALSGSR